MVVENMLDEGVETNDGSGLLESNVVRGGFVEEVASAFVKRGRGRPKGSRNKNENGEV